MRKGEAMKKFFAASFVVAALALFSAPALAADRPVPYKAAPMAAPAPVFNWTGFYVGGVYTHLSGHTEHCAIGAGCDPSFPQNHLRGSFGGVTVGYNWQWTNWVFGAEGDWSWGHARRTNPGSVAFGCGAAPGCVSEIRELGTVRGRVGYAFDRLLAYMTAGAAFTRIHASIDNPPSGATATKTSFVWGGGLEYAFAPNWSAKIEYLRIEPIKDFVYDSLSLCGAGTECFLRSHHADAFRVGLNYRFGGDPWGKSPVVAKY
jgi:outer membrane immunogenic protein